ELYKYDQLLNDVEGGITDFKLRLNEQSLSIVDHAIAEPFVLESSDGTAYQFMRNAYFKKAGRFSSKIRFFRIVELRDKFNKK
ncbi:MAG: glutamine--tRNA ligase, partial [Clostridia bacterium]